jgi:hypothetical protein
LTGLFHAHSLLPKNHRQALLWNRQSNPHPLGILDFDEPKFIGLSRGVLVEGLDHADLVVQRHVSCVVPDARELADLDVAGGDLGLLLLGCFQEFGEGLCFGLLALGLGFFLRSTWL